MTDTFYFVHRPLTSDGSITVRVTSLTEVAESSPTRNGRPVSTKPTVVPWSKAGLIITAGARQGSAYAAVMVTGSHGTRMQWNYTGDTPGLPGRVSAASPRWLRLTRAGDVITGYDSANGTNWTKIGAVTLPGLAPTVQAGLFATSPGYSQQTSQAVTSASGTAAPTDATATFDRVGLHGGWPGSSWTGTMVSAGPDSPYVTGHEAGDRRAGGVFTVTGSGDIAPDVTDGVPIDVLLAGLFIALVAVLAVGAQFMTAEYRRGLIRVTLAASPRRGRALAAKAIVLGAVTFAAGLAGAAAAAVRCPSGGCADDPAKISLTGIYLGQAVVAVLAVTAVSGEYGTGMIRLTLAATPRRVTVLAAKAAIVAGLTLAAGTIAVLASLLAGRLILPGHGIGPSHGYPALSFSDGPVLRAACGSVLYLVLIALLSLGAAAVLREAAAAIGVVLGLLYLFPIIAAAGNATVSRHLEQIGPMTAGLAIQATTGLNSLPISPWAGLGVLAAWAAGALLLGGLLLRLRDA